MIVLPPSPVPNEDPAEIGAVQKMVGAMPGNEDLPLDKAEKTQKTQKCREMDVAGQGDNLIQQQSGPDFPPFA